MPIPYLPPSASITAAHWTAIFQAADAQLTSALAGLSAVFAGVDKQWDRCFFNFDPQNLPANLHPVARRFLANASYGPPTQPSLFLRQYSDSAITTAVAALTVSATSAKFGVAKLSTPTWAAWSAAIYPSGFTGHSTTGIDPPAVNLLDVSLAVVTVTVSSVVYAVTVQDVTTAEHAQPFKPIDFFVASTFTWSGAWNKYQLVRVHNCSALPASVTFGTVSTTLAPGASLTFRLLASGLWTQCGNYFHWMESGDPRFRQCREATGGAASVTQPGIVANVIAAVGYVNFGQYFDVTQFWDLSPIYNNPSYAPTAYEKTPPSGGYLPALGTGDLLGDLIVHRGQVLIANRLIAPTRAQFTFAGFASLAGALTAAGGFSRITAQPISAGINGLNGGATTINNLEIYYGGAGQQDMIDLSSPLITYITGGNPASYIKASQSTTPPSLMLPWIYFYALACAANNTSTNYNFYNWAVDGGGNPYQTTLVTLPVTNLGMTSTPTTQVFLPTQTVAAALAWIASTSMANGFIAITALPPLSTPFGPVVMWQETWPLAPWFTGIPALASTYITKVQYQQGAGLIVTRARFIADGANVWPPRTPAASFMAWNFPRVDRRYTLQRFFLHAPADAPMMPNWSGSFAGSNYANLRYAPSGYPWADDLSTNEFIPVQAFYETAPISVDAPGSLLPTLGLDMPGLSRMGAYLDGIDNWPIFANWCQSLGNLTYNDAPDIYGGAQSLTITTSNSSGTDWYSLNNNLILPSATYGTESIGAGQPAWRNVLPLQVEHINLLASLINAEPPARLTVGAAGGTTWSLTFASGTVFIAVGGSGYLNTDTGLTAAGGAVTFNVSSVDGNGAITGIAVTSSSNTVPFDAYATPQRPFAVSGGSGSGAGIDTSSGSGSGLSFLPIYNPLAVPVPSGSGMPAVWPRTTWFAWNGPTPGGADPIATYLASLGLGIQTTLPDSYGAAIVNEYVFQGIINTVLNPVPLSAPATSYYKGFTPAFALTAGAYRWISISDARALYGNWSLPFNLNGLFAPMTFTVQNSYTTTGNTFIGAHANPGWVWLPESSDPHANLSSAGGYVYYTLAGFYNNGAGNWLMNPASQILRAQINPPVTVVPPQPWYSTEIANDYDLTGVTLTDVDWYITPEYGPLLGLVNSFGVPAAYTALVWLLEGTPAQIAAAIPQNYAYYDPAFVANNPAVFAALGTAVIPIIVDNTVESDAPEVTILNGAGGAGHYDHTLTTSLGNARLLTQLVDNQVGNQQSTGAGNPGGAGGGSGGL